MKFTPAFAALLSVLATAHLASAQGVVDECSVTHNTGNTFAIHVDDVPDQSLSSICGHSANNIQESASAFNVQVLGDIDCATADAFNTMDLSVTLNKQSPQVELQALQNGIIAAFGTAGVSFPTSVCDLSGIPTRRRA